MKLELLQQPWVVDLVQRLPQGAVSRAWGWLARRKRPSVGVSLLKHAFVQAVGIDMAEADDDIQAYHTLEELFVRRLRAGSRRIDPDTAAVISPVDGVMGQSGVVRAGELMQVKGRAYSLAGLLGSAEDASRFEGGGYCTLYLAPMDYHRIHVPLSGQVSEAMVIPGGLMPVFPAALSRVDGLFARNERLITYIDTPKAGRLAVVKVGATLVGRITLAYDQDVWTNQPGQKQRRVHYDPPRLLHKGGELGAFELGSTVVVVSEPGAITLEPPEDGERVRMGHRIGTVAARRGKDKDPKAPRRRKPSEGARRAPRKLS